EALGGPFDLVFIDADKPKYPDYLRAVRDKLRPGALIVADNVSEDNETSRPYRELVAADEGLDTVGLSIAGGFWLSRVRECGARQRPCGPDLRWKRSGSASTVGRRIPSSASWALTGSWNSRSRRMPVSSSISMTSPLAGEEPVCLPRSWRRPSTASRSSSAPVSRTSSLTRAWSSTPQRWPFLP